MQAGERLGIDYFKDFTIVASNDLNVANISNLNAHGHEIDVFGVGTNLITCQNQPALGCVYKLVEINGTPRIKLSQDIVKVTIPGKKVPLPLSTNSRILSSTHSHTQTVHKLSTSLSLMLFSLGFSSLSRFLARVLSLSLASSSADALENAYRLFGSKEKHAVLDIMLEADEEPPQVGKRILCRHPFAEHLLANVTPSRVQPLLKLVFDARPLGDVLTVTLDDMKQRLKEDMDVAREDHLRHAAPYKISVSQQLYDRLHTLWLKNVPVEEL